MQVHSICEANDDPHAHQLTSAHQHYALLHEIAPCLSVDELGAYYVTSHTMSSRAAVATAQSCGNMRLLALTSTCTMTGMWTVPVGCTCRLIPKY